jgi:hypothetical protein
MYQFCIPPNDVTCLSIISVVGTENIKLVPTVTSLVLYWNISITDPLPQSVSDVVKLKKNGFPGNHPV